MSDMLAIHFPGPFELLLLGGVVLVPVGVIVGAVLLVKKRTPKGP